MRRWSQGWAMRPSGRNRPDASVHLVRHLGLRTTRQLLTIQIFRDITCLILTLKINVFLLKFLTDSQHLLHTFPRTAALATTPEKASGIRLAKSQPLSAGLKLQSQQPLARN